MYNTIAQHPLSREKLSREGRRYLFPLPSVYAHISFRSSRGRSNAARLASHGSGIRRSSLEIAIDHDQKLFPGQSQISSSQIAHQHRGGKHGESEVSFARGDSHDIKFLLACAGTPHAGLFAGAHEEIVVRQPNDYGERRDLDRPG